MTSMPLVVTGTTPRQVSARLRAMKKRVDNVEPAWPKVGAYLSRATRRQFATQGKAFGTPWAPLKPEYKLWKLRNGYPRSILVRTGDLRSEFTGRPMKVEKYYAHHARFGSDSNLSLWHHKGTQRNGRRALPPRPILVVTPEVSKDVRDILQKYIVGKFGVKGDLPGE